MNNAANTFKQNIEYLKGILGEEKIEVFLRINALDLNLKRQYKKTNFKEYKIYEEVKKCLKSIS